MKFAMFFLIILNEKQYTIFDYCLINDNFNFFNDFLIPFIITVFGTFLGFGLTIIGQRIYDNSKKNKEIKELSNNLINELKKMQIKNAFVENCIKSFIALIHLIVC